MSVAMKSCEEFFQTAQPPPDLSSVTQEVQTFVSRQHARSRCVAVVTSGGTSVPVERSTVRYLDNMSTGQRGAASAEYFLAQGYAVIFLYRGTSLRPFHRHFISDNPLDLLTLVDNKLEVSKSIPEVVEKKFQMVFPRYSMVKGEGTLHLVSYTSVFEYLFYLKEISITLRPIQGRALFYLAAAVSDFYIDQCHMPQHKIQSSGDLELKFSHTPKILLLLTSVWVPKAFVITFKLETEEDLLIANAKAALEKYSHQIVVANMLKTKRTEVILVSLNGKHKELVTKKLITDQRLPGGELLTELEEEIVKEVCKHHRTFTE